MSTTTDTTYMKTAYDPWDERVSAELYAHFAQARLSAPVFYSDTLDRWVVSRADDVEEVLTNSELFSATVATSPVRPMCAEAMKVLAEGGWKHQSVFSSDPPRHRHFRSLVQRVFTPRRVAILEPFIREQVVAGCDRLETAGRADIIAELCYPVPGLTILKLLGFPFDYLEEMKQGASTRLLLISGRLDPTEQVEVAHRLVTSWHFARDIVSSRIGEPMDDLISDLLAVRGGDDSVLTLDQLTSMLLTFFSAGHETSTYMLANALFHLLGDRESWDAICRDPGLCVNTVEECLRFDAPIYAFQRQARMDTELRGMRIPAGDRVMVLLGSANHDEALRSDAGRLDIRRDGARHHFSFGKGNHYCVGAPLARLEGKIALEVLSSRFPGMRLASAEPPPYMASAIFRAPLELWVDPTPAGDS